MAGKIPPALLYLCGAVVVYLVYVAVELYVSKSRRKRERSSASCDATILVCLYSNKENFATAATCANMLKAALCPARMTFAVVQNVHNTSIDVFELLKEANSYDSTYDLKESQVRSFTVYEDIGYGAAMNIIMEDLLDDVTDEYLLFTTPGSVFVNNFDHLLTQQIERGTERGTGRTTVLTSHGPPFADTAFEFPPGKKQNMMSYLAATMPERPIRPPNEQYFFGLDENGKMVDYAVPDVVSEPMLSIACSPVCTFVRKDAQRQGSFTRNPPVVSLSSVFFPGRFVFTLPRVVFQPKRKRKKKKREIETLTPTKFLNTMTEDSILGLVNPGDEKEIKMKYGSLAGLQRIEKILGH